MDDFVMVRITGKEIVLYDQTVRMPRADFDRLNAMLNSDDRAENQNAQDSISGLIDPNEIYDSDGFEVDDFSIEGDS